MVFTDPVSKKNIGIICDVCGSICKDKFSYYNARFDFVSVDAALQKTGIMDVDRRILDLDFCAKCFDDLKLKVQSVIAKRESSDGSWTTTGK